MRPLIGIVSRVEYPGDTDKLVVNDEYRRAIIDCGGNPFLILPSQIIDYGSTKGRDIPSLFDEEKSMILKQLELCDGILMPGGFKMLEYDFFILDYAIKNNVPILGICLGMQIMANYKRDVWNEKNDPNGLCHRVESGELVHFVDVDVDSKLYSIIGEHHFKVNSLHNFHALASDYYNTVCYSEDGLIEGIEYSSNDFNIGVQWHPEKNYKTDSVSRRILNSFILHSVSYMDSKKKVIYQWDKKYMDKIKLYCYNTFEYFGTPCQFIGHMSKRRCYNEKIWNYVYS